MGTTIQTARYSQTKGIRTLALPAIASFTAKSRAARTGDVRSQDAALSIRSLRRKKMQNHIDYNEFSRFQTSEHSAFQYRTEQPDWLNSEEKLRKVLAQLIWNVARPGQNAGRVPDALVEDLATLRFVSEVAFIQFCQKQKITREVEAFARSVVHCHGMLQLFTILLWGYRTGASSPELSAQTLMTPVAIRQRLFRIRKVAQKLFDGSLVERPRAAKKAGPHKKRGVKRTFSYAAAKRMADAGIPTKDISKKLGVSRRQVQAVLREMKRAAAIAPIRA
jgi:hypothetical protein